jgi:peptidoglycan/LPS O-acetylase OafA/YrhL
MASTPRDQYVNNLLRGLAILGVLVIHFQSSIHGGFWLNSGTWRIFTFLDQLSRLCVPVFVALSGYGFWQKYQGVELKPWEFIQRQAGKLLPLYFTASAFAYAVLYFVSYRYSRPLPSFFLQVLTGQADYQLYFVPMIFQLYLLFPWLRLLVKKFRWTSLVLAAIFQAGLYLISSHLGSDQQQYIWFFTWIFYFVLGMHLPEIIPWFTSSLRRVWGLSLLSVAAWITVSGLAMVQIESGIDPIVALRFTRIEILVYATLAVVCLFVLGYLASDRAVRFTRAFTYLGNYSYPIYLFHTMVLRAIFAFI